MREDSPLDSREDAVARLVPDHPAARNSLSPAMLDELTAEREQPDRGMASFKRTKGKYTRLVVSIRHRPKPVTAEIHGIPKAERYRLVATCDLAVAANDAQFATPRVNIRPFAQSRWLRLRATSGGNRPCGCS